MDGKSVPTVSFTNGVTFYAISPGLKPVYNLVVKTYRNYEEKTVEVNLFEDEESPNAIRAVRKNIFRTESGTRMLETMYGING